MRPTWRHVRARLGSAGRTSSLAVHVGVWSLHWQLGLEVQVCAMYRECDGVKGDPPGGVTHLVLGVVRLVEDPVLGQLSCQVLGPCCTSSAVVTAVLGAAPGYTGIGSGTHPGLRRVKRKYPGFAS